MTPLEKIKSFLAQYPGKDILSQFRVDYTDMVPGNGGIFPTGLVELSRKSDILGMVTLENQLNFAIYCLLTKSPGDDMGAMENAEWVMDFQRWIQRQSAAGNAPVFGDDPRKERMTAQNGALYDTDMEGTAVYMIQIAVNYVEYIG